MGRLQLQAANPASAYLVCLDLEFHGASAITSTAMPCCHCRPQAALDSLCVVDLATCWLTMPARQAGALGHYIAAGLNCMHLPDSDIHLTIVRHHDCKLAGNQHARTCEYGVCKPWIIGWHFSEFRRVRCRSTHLDVSDALRLFVCMRANQSALRFPGEKFSCETEALGDCLHDV